MKFRFVATVAVVGALLATALVQAEEKKGKAFDASKLVGKWKVTGGKKAGADPSDNAKDGLYVFTKDMVSIIAMDMTLFEIKYTTDGKASPAAIDMEITKSPGDSANGSKAKGIIEVSGNKMKICYPPMGGDRPKKFDGADPNYYFTLERVTKDKKKDKDTEDK